MNDLDDTLLFSTQHYVNGNLLKASASRLLFAALERLSGIEQLRKVYEEIKGAKAGISFVEKALTTLKCSYLIDNTDLQNLPESGPCIVAANHPFGGLDGLILMNTLATVRRDFRVLANNLLYAIPELKPSLIPIDPFEGKARTKNNVGAMMKAIRWIKQGGLLVIFPAGEVSHLHILRKRIQDPEWKFAVARISRIGRCPVVPVFFSGRNSNIFQLAGILHPRLRTALLPRELIKSHKRDVIVKIGKPIPYKKLQSFEDDRDLTSYLQFRTNMLAYSISPSFHFQKASDFTPKIRQPALSAPANKDHIAQEMMSLHPSCTLLESGEFKVFLADPVSIPAALNEIGRLREETFRAAGEGTGKSIDTDCYDQSYLHLILWNRDRGEIVGAYRIGLTDKIVPAYGVKGLYTHSLFRYGYRLIEQIGPALELGRSFVRREYQKSPSALFLLWKGIGQFIAANPHYRSLFGPVSISSSYLPCSRHIMAKYLELHCLDPHLSELVRPRHRFKKRGFCHLDTHIARFGGKDPDEISCWVSQLEKDGKGLPILLKHYIRLGGKILSISVDPSFGNVVDALVLVDICSADPKTLARYMGSSAYEHYMHYNQTAEQAISLAA